MDKEEEKKGLQKTCQKTHRPHNRLWLTVGTTTKVTVPNAVQDESWS